MSHPKHIRRARIAAFLSVILAAMAVAPAHEASAAETRVEANASSADSCTPVVIMAFRGSGESTEDVDSLNDPFDHIQDTDGWEGKTLHRALRAYEGAVDSSIASAVPVIDVGSELDPDTQVTGFPSRDLFTEIAVLAPVLLNSAARGTDEAAARMSAIQASQSEGCARTRFVLVGYSQGAVVARSLSQIFPEDIAGTVLIGDPFQAPNARGNEGEGADGEGAIRVQNVFNKAAMDRYYNNRVHQTSLCHDKDPVCNFNLFQLVTDPASDHENYVVDAAEIDRKGQEIADLVTNILEEPAGAATTPPLDINFILNVYSGRSGGNLERHYLVQSMDTLRGYLEDNPDTRVSVQVLGWTGLEPTSDIDEIVDFVTTIPDSYNEYPMRYQEYYVDAAINDPAFFRPGADQVIIGARQPFGLGESAQAGVATSIAEKIAAPRPAVFNPIGQLITGGSTRIYNAFGATDKDDPFYSPQADSSPFEDIYASAFKRTRAVLGYSPVMVEGQVVTLGSDGSTGSGDLTASFEIDPSDPAEVGNRSTGGRLTAPAAGEALIRLTVTDEAGGIDIVETNVTVLSEADLRLATSPSNGAPSSSAALSGDINSATGKISLSLSSGAEAIVTLVRTPESSVDPFDDISRVVVAKFAAEGVTGVRTRSVLLPSTIAAGSYLLLIRESTGHMGTFPITIT